MRTILIMGAAGRDFHDFNVVFRDDSETRVADGRAAAAIGTLEDAAALVAGTAGPV